MNTNYTDYFGTIEVTALYIEDDDSIRHTFKKFLGRRFNKLFEANNGEDGLKIFEQEKIDVIITDIRMPKKDGLELISDIKKSGGTPEFIVTSAFSDKDYLIKSIDLGVTKYILKPVKIEEMKKIINETIKLVKLKKKESSYQEMIEVLFNTQNGIIFLTNGSYLLNINQKGLDTVGYSSINDFKEFYNCICEKFILPKDIEAQENVVIKDNFMKSMKISSEHNTSFKVHMFDESEKKEKIFSLKAKKHNNDLYIVNLFDITDLEHMNRELEVKNLELSSYYNIIDEHLIASETDLNGNITSVSQAFCKKTGFSKKELIGENHRIMKHPDTPTESYHTLWDTIISGKTWTGETHNLTKDKKDLWVYTIIKPKKDKNGTIIGYTSIREDITDKKRIEILSITDNLTQLFNRNKLNSIFQNELNRALRYNYIFSVILLDIDKFKLVNDNYGHNVGDYVLRELAKILKENIRKTDIVGRWGGEEFLIIAINSCQESSIQLAEKIRSKVEAFKFDTIEKTTISLGVSSFTAHDTQESMIKRADDALYLAKDSGRNCVKFM